MTRIGQVLAVCISAIAVIMWCGPATIAQQARFSTATDLVRLHVTVLDERTRMPVRGLTAADFTIRVGGEPQTIVALDEVARLGPAAGGKALTDAAVDVATNDLASPGLFVIVMNDAQGTNDPFERQTGKGVAHRIVDALGPNDMAAVVFYRDNRHAQDFTTDRTLLRRAIDTFNPMDSIAGGSLGRVSRFLAGMRGHRSAIFYISAMTKIQGAMSAAGPERLGRQSLAVEWATGGDWRSEVGPVDGAWVSNVPIYPIGTAGLRAPTSAELLRGRLTNVGEVAAEDALRALAAITGGRVVAGHNNPAALVPELFSELSSYYTLGYKPGYPLDGRMRWLQVGVDRPGVLVMPNDVAITSPRTLGTAAKTPIRADRESGLVDLMMSPLPVGDLPLRLAHASFLTDAVEAAVLVTLGLPVPAPGVASDYRVTLNVHDGEGRRRLLSETHGVNLAGGGAELREGADVVFRLAMRPGRYSLRVFVESPGMGEERAGSVYSTMVVPDFRRERLTMSGVAVGLAGRAAAIAGQKVDGVVPFAPTSRRDFIPTDRVGALLRLHQSSRSAPLAAVLETEILEATGERVMATTRNISAAAFESPDGVEHRVDVPVQTLGHGSYVLRFVATAGTHRVQRDVRFTVVRSQ